MLADFPVLIRPDTLARLADFAIPNAESRALVRMMA
jgi:hypothetical protein